MRRADRLFQIVQLLRRRRLTTAAQLAERLEVSERTIYRDIRDLTLSGVPITGEAGVGYLLGKDFDLPPLMFNVDEVQALALGARMVETWGDEELRQAARSVLTKVEAVLPPSMRHRVHDTALYSLPFKVSPEVRRNVGLLRKAIDARHQVQMDYRDKHDAATRRTVSPLGLYYWGSLWNARRLVRAAPGLPQLPARQDGGSRDGGAVHERPPPHPRRVHPRHARGGRLASAASRRRGCGCSCRLCCCPALATGTCGCRSSS